MRLQSHPVPFRCACRHIQILYEQFLIICLWEFSLFVVFIHGTINACLNWFKLWMTLHHTNRVYFLLSCEYGAGYYMCAVVETILICGGAVVFMAKRRFVVLRKCIYLLTDAPLMLLLKSNTPLARHLCTYIACRKCLIQFSLYTEL